MTIPSNILRIAYEVHKLRYDNGSIELSDFVRASLRAYGHTIEYNDEKKTTTFNGIDIERIIEWKSEHPRSVNIADVNSIE